MPTGQRCRLCSISLEIKSDPRHVHDADRSVRGSVWQCVAVAKRQLNRSFTCQSAVNCDSEPGAIGPVQLGMTEPNRTANSGRRSDRVTPRASRP